MLTTAMLDRLSPQMREIWELQQELAVIQRGEAVASAHQIWTDELDALRPVDDLSTNEVANKYRFLPTEGGGKKKFQTADVPYVEEIHDALDDPTKRLVLVKGPARSIKTTAAENHLLKIGRFGPSRNVLWYMHSTSDLEDYVEERGEFFMTLEEHGLAHKIGRTPRENSRLRKKVDGKIWRWLAANKSTTRGKAAPYIVVDEVDAMRKEIRRAITTLVRNRQREFGNMAKAYIASHSDEGPTEGIDALLVDSDLRVRMWKCMECGGLASPAAEAPEGRRIRWNVPDLMSEGEDLERKALIEFVARNVHLTCPHCGTIVDDRQRLQLDKKGQWFGRGQEIAPVPGSDEEQIVGERIETDTAGFVIHAFMSSLVTLGGLAREWVEAKLDQIETGNHSKMKEVSVKSLGETYRLDIAAARPRDWKVIRGRLMDSGYRMGTVPRGVDFITVMVDVGGAKFDIGAIGWSHLRESWLLSRRTMMEWTPEGAATPRSINPGDRLSDWSALDHLFDLQFPLNDGSGRVLMVAKVCVDTGGVPGVTNNARLWASNLIARAVNPVPAWRIALLKGQGNLKPPKDKSKTDNKEFYTSRREIRFDDANRELPVPIQERTVDTDQVKLIIADRMEIETPGPGMMHIPSDVDDRHVRELVAETLENGVWIRRGANELWDIWVGAEVGRSLLAPESITIDWKNGRPFWATPFHPDGRDDNEAPGFAARLAALARGGATKEDY